VIYDDTFSAAMNLSHINTRVVSDLCRLCNIISNNTQLVVPHSAQCLPELSHFHNHGNHTANCTTVTSTTGMASRSSLLPCHVFQKSFTMNTDNPTFCKLNFCPALLTVACLFCIKQQKLKCSDVTLS